MRRFFTIVCFAVPLLCFLPQADGQEVLRASRIHARSSRKAPSLGLPKRTDGQPDPVIWYGDGIWHGADSLRGLPFWNMAHLFSEADEAAVNKAGKPVETLLEPFRALGRVWAEERPKGAVQAVWGPYRDKWYIALCKKTRGGMGWKSIGFLVPPEGMDAGKSVYAYSVSVNWLEFRTGYDFFPNLPAHLQEIIEEMTSAELLCPFQEFDLGDPESPDREIDYDWEEDYRDR